MRAYCRYGIGPPLLLSPLVQVLKACEPAGLAKLSEIVLDGSDGRAVSAQGR